MDNNALTTLTFSIYSNKGVYALLLGAGISKPSGIPSCWDIVTDLLRQLSALHGVKDETDRVKWYKETYGKDIDYSSLLDELVKTPTERVNLMKSYFEQNEEDLQSHLKEPTKAHYAIAKLVKEGFIKVILTTNFDRLLEKAIESEGITPQVICHEDDIAGAVPLVHSQLTIVKINGDYIDCRFRNTAEELDHYSPQLKEYLLRIFSDFGLITCGWSATWDKGLSDIIRSIDNRRYGSYYTYVDNYSKELKSLSDFRGGVLCQIKNADDFFSEINERVCALVECNSEHPLNKNILIARAKKYLASPQWNIAFADLVEGEGERIYEKIYEKANYNFSITPQIFNEYWKLHTDAVDTLIPLSILTVRWGNIGHFQHFMSILARLSIHPLQSGSTCNSNTIPVHYMSSIIIMYAIGIACIKFHRYDFLDTMFCLKIPQHHFSSEHITILSRIHPLYWDREQLNELLGDRRYYTPMSTILSRHLRTYFQNEFDTDVEYDETLCIFEYLLSLYYVFTDCYQFGGTWTPWGEYQWRKGEYLRNNTNLYTVFWHAADEDKDNWEPLKQGMFNGNYSIYQKVKQQTDEFLAKVHCY